MEIKLHAFFGSRCQLNVSHQLHAPAVLLTFKEPAVVGLGGTLDEPAPGDESGIELRSSMPLERKRHRMRSVRSVIAAH